jgi:pimeloyl-ACP methyl ester carboxylesterase
MLAVLPAAEATAAPPLGTVEEHGVASEAPDANLVRESFVRVYEPLSESVGPHPEACDWLTFLRFRHPGGPAKAGRADAVVVIIPGFLGGAGSFDQVARNTVRNAAARGAKIEFWALDRRANCLEDHTGVQAAARDRDPSIAYEYYWGGREVDGKRFEGFKEASETEFVREFGLERTMRDWYAVLRAMIPSQRTRVEKVICGGHSFGGPLTTAFAGWDFDGDPNTTDDAGYNQCAGFAGLDTRFSLGSPGGGTPGFGTLVSLGGQATDSPFVNIPPLTPETIQVPAVFGVGAFYDPQGTDLLRELPSTTNIDVAQRALFSRDAVHFATGIPSIRDFTITNQVTLAGVFDDNSAPLSFMRSSVGMVTGGELADKNFPSPDPTLALPEEPETPLYSWQNYQAVGAGGASVPLNDSGEPYTSRESEASDVSQLARTMFEAPANFIEQYFPNRLLQDADDAGRGDRSGGLSNLRYDGISKRPAILVQAGDSGTNSGEDSGPPVAGQPPNGQSLSRRVTIPGYNHLDVLTADRVQNDGRPEPASTALSDFVLDVVRAPGAMQLSVRPPGVRVGRRVRLRFRVRSPAESCKRGVLVRVAGRRVRTRVDGRASLRRRFVRVGRRRVTARKAGCRPDSVRLRVRRR